MDELCRVIQGLRLIRKSITVDELVDFEEPRAEFEAHVAADVGKDYWIYTVNGRLLDGDAIVVRASKFFPDVAENLAQEGLRDTIKAAKRYNANTGLQSTVEVRGLQ